jgi:hypothetical protein
MVLTPTDYPSLIPLDLLYCTLFRSATEKTLDSENFLQYTLSMAQRGRPKLDLAKRETLQIRVFPEVKRLFEEAARSAGQSLTAWTTQRLQDALQEELQNNGKNADDSP